MERILIKPIKADLQKKIVLLSGPRQVGKTTLAQSISENYEYLSYDFGEHRSAIKAMRWPKDVELVILDELHKMPKWKHWLKGVFDVQKQQGRTSPKIIVTGSARLDTARKMGDSLAGRHFSFRLNPLTLKELAATGEGGNYPDAFERIMKWGGFPEPFLNNDLDFYRKWQISHLDIILRQDVLDLEQIRQLNKLETLVELLRHKVGTPCSYSGLAEDLEVDHGTVKRWLTILENLFVIFRVQPYHRNIARAILKSPKFYFYDLGRVPDQKGGRYENFVALSLMSEIEFLRDTKGRKLSLNYLRDKDGHEIDFFITENEKHLLALECKWAETQPDSSFKAFFGSRPSLSASYIQLVAEAPARREYDFGLRVEPAEKWLKSIAL